MKKYTCKPGDQIIDTDNKICVVAEVLFSGDEKEQERDDITVHPVFDGQILKRTRTCIGISWSHSEKNLDLWFEEKQKKKTKAPNSVNDVIEYMGRKMPLIDWVKELKLCYNTVVGRYRKHMPIKIVMMPGHLPRNWRVTCKAKETEPHVFPDQIDRAVEALS